MDEAEWTRVRKDETVLRPIVDAIGRRHGVVAVPERFPTGSVPVYALGSDHVLKLFGPHEQSFQRTEAVALAAVEGRLAIPTPRLVAADRLDGWPYVLMGRIEGAPLRQAWPRVPATERLRLVRQIGRAVADLHALPPPDALRLDWAAFIAEQTKTAQARQAARGLAPRWRAQIPAFLADVNIPAAEPARPVLLHTEVMLEHVLVRPAGNGWEATGLIDFEPAMVGDPGYELASVGLFVSEGEPELLTAFLEAYGGFSSGSRFARRCLGFALLHRYSHLGWYLDRLPPPSTDTLESAAERWFSASPDDST